MPAPAAQQRHAYMPATPALIAEDMVADYTGRPGVTIRRWAHE